MLKEKKNTQLWAVASANLQEAYTDFILSRQAMLCKASTLRFYSFTAGRFVSWLEANGIISVEEVTSRNIRAYLSQLAEKRLSDSYVNGHARAIKTFVRFLQFENYIEEAPTFQMPSIAKKRLPVLSASQLRRFLEACHTDRDKALVMLMVDTGVRQKELSLLNWEDVNIKNGLVNINRGKGGKYRSVVIGAKTRRALVKYRRTIDHQPHKPLFQTKQGNHFSFPGLRSCLLRISKRAGIHVSPHILRRTFATLSLRSGMNPLHLQGLLGHSSLEMTRRYVQMVDKDLMEAHKAYGPLDNL